MQNEKDMPGADTEVKQRMFSPFSWRRLTAVSRQLTLNAFGLARDALLPAQCAACRAPVASEGLCAPCWAGVSFIARPYCERLGIPFAYDPGPGILSEEALADPPAFNRARAAVRYENAARDLVHAFKFHDRLDLAPILARWMTQAGAELFTDADMIVPVPLHWKRAFARRYNQSAVLADRIGAATGVTVSHTTLRRIRPTEHQTGLSRAERGRNVQGAFAVPGEARPALQGRRVILIDDVLTSGATVDACARALLRAKAKSVDVLVFTRVVDGARAPI